MKKILYKSVIVFIIIAIFFSCINLNTFVYADQVDLSQYESWKDIPIEVFQNVDNVEDIQALTEIMKNVNYDELSYEDQDLYNDDMYAFINAVQRFYDKLNEDIKDSIADAAGPLKGFVEFIQAADEFLSSGVSSIGGALIDSIIEERFNSPIYTNPLTTGQANQEAENVTPDTIIGDAETFIKDGQDSNIATINQENADTVLNSIYNIMLAIGITVTVIWGLIIAIKLMMSSVEEKAEYKKLLWPYLVGCIVIFGSFIIWKIVIVVMNSVM